MANQSIVLIGPMGAGKSTIGRLLANKLGYDFFDSDQVIVERTGADISWIFDVEGESGFRDRESSVLAELCERSSCVVATGGGAVLRKSNRLLLSKNARVVYLTASIGQLVARTAKDKKRPLLQVENPKAKIIELFEQRDPLYREVADLVVETDGLNPKAVAQLIAEKTV